MTEEKRPSVIHTTNMRITRLNEDGSVPDPCVFKPFVVQGPIEFNITFEQPNVHAMLRLIYNTDMTWHIWLPWNSIVAPRLTWFLRQWGKVAAIPREAWFRITSAAYLLRHGHGR